MVLCQDDACGEADTIKTLVFLISSAVFDHSNPIDLRFVTTIWGWPRH